MTVRQIFDRPEYRLALRIASTVLFILLLVVLISFYFAVRADNERQERFFRSWELSLTGRPTFVEDLEEPEEMFFGRQNRRRHLRNMVVLFSDGEWSVVGSLENEWDLKKSDFENIWVRTLQEKNLSGSDFILYSFPAGDRTVVLYESSELLRGPGRNLFFILILWLGAFSVLLFFVSYRIAKQVISPIEELAERERSYARHIAHEIKTPLAVMKSDLELALAMPEEQEDRIASAIQEISSMRSIVDDLLLLSVGESALDKRPINLRNLTEEILREGSDHISDPVTWEIESEKDMSIEGDPRLIKTLLKNLIANVRAHAEPGTVALIKFENTGFSFENTAKDIPDSISKNAFKPFVWTPWKWSGIGLSLVKRIADLHDWKVAFEKIDKKKVRMKVGY